MVHQVRKHSEFMAGQLHRSAVDGNASCAWVKRERAATELRLRKPARAADQCSNAGQDFFDAEGLCDVVVRPTVDPPALFRASSRARSK
jgi:hypothetical protein